MTSGRNQKTGNRIRAFIAIELPENILAEIVKVQKGLKSYGFKVKWVRPENIHLTLKFLGDIDLLNVPKVYEAISRSTEGFGTISLKAMGIGAFPGLKRPRVIWVGIDGETEILSQFHKGLEKNLAEIGFSKERRPFTGHLTLGRSKGYVDIKKFSYAMEKFKGFETERFISNEVVLFKSVLKQTGAVYTPLERITLSGTGK